ncbi:unnamed protein product [Clonostachys chloroleuca]|uniref:Uncharacterized protein n=1 Tax=Clonostachys chloroleuca TaxID=1926264 RepID=A0AA35M9A7_9HYPO|nr:unnamed protein product [Clonostachys chloroleuca]
MLALCVNDDDGGTEAVTAFRIKERLENESIQLLSKYLLKDIWLLLHYTFDVKTHPWDFEDQIGSACCEEPQ